MTEPPRRRPENPVTQGMRYGVILIAAVPWAWRRFSRNRT